jgi:hypothetical protein
MNPTITIITRHLVSRGSECLNRCLDSVSSFAHEIQHIIVPDHIGVGWAGSIKNVVNACDKISGKWVWMLDDDDVCTSPDLPRQIESIDEIMTDLQIIIARSKLRSAKSEDGYKVYPPEELFKQENITVFKISTIGMPNYILRQDLFKKYIPFGATRDVREHDWWIMEEIIKDDKHMHFETYFWDKVIMRQPTQSHGR